MSLSTVFPVLNGRVPSRAAVGAWLSAHRLSLTLLLVASALVLVAVPEFARAGAGGAEFDEIWDKLVGWMQGTPGKIVMIMSFIVAVVAGIVGQSLEGFMISLGIGIGVYYAPMLTEGIVTATLPLAAVTLPALTALPLP